MSLSPKLQNDKDLLLLKRAPEQEETSSLQASGECAYSEDICQIQMDNRVKSLISCGLTLNPLLSLKLDLFLDEFLLLLQLAGSLFT